MNRSCYKDTNTGRRCNVGRILKEGPIINLDMDDARAYYGWIHTYIYNMIYTNSVYITPTKHLW